MSRGGCLVSSILTYKVDVQTKFTSRTLIKVWSADTCATWAVDSAILWRVVRGAGGIAGYK